MAGAEGLGQIGEVQGEASGADTDLRRDREHAGDAEADLRLLQGGKRLAERTVGERDRLLAVAGDMQRDRRHADDLPALRMVGRCDLERTPAELRGGTGSVVTSAFAASSSVVIATSSPSSALAASCDATSTGRAPASSRTPAAWRSSARRAVTGHAGADGLAGDVVPEGELLVALDEQVRLEEFLDRCEQVRGRPAERARQLVEGERAAERGGDRDGVACLVGEPAEPLAHLLVHTPGKLAVDQLGAAIDNAYPLLFLQPEERLDDEERAAVGFRQLLQDRLIGLRAEHVRRQLRDRIVIERPEDDRARSLFLELFERVHERRRFARRAKRDHPGDRQSHQAHRQRAEGRDRSAVCPLGVVDGDQERRLERRALEQLLQVSKQPEPLLGLCMQRRERVGIEQRLGSVEERREQCCKLDHRLARIGGAAADSDAEAASDRRDLGEQAALAHAGRPSTTTIASAPSEAFELGSNQREFCVASMELSRGARRHRLLVPSISKRQQRLQIAGSCDARVGPARRNSPLPQLGRRSDPDERPAEHRSRPRRLGRRVLLERRDRAPPGGGLPVRAPSSR